MTLCLKTSGDLDGLREVSLVRYLHDVPPAALEILRENGRHVLDFGWAWRRWALILGWRCCHRLFSSLSDQLTVDGFALNCPVKRTEDATAIAELPRVSVRIDRRLTFSSGKLFGLLRLVVIKIVAHVIILLVRPLVSTFDQIIFDDLRNFGQRVIGLKNRKRFRQEFQRLIPYQLAVNKGNLLDKSTQVVAQSFHSQWIDFLHHVLAHRISRDFSSVQVTAQIIR